MDRRDASRVRGEHRRTEGAAASTSNEIKKERNTKIAKKLLQKEQVTEKEVAGVCEVLARGDLLPTMTVTFVDPDEEVLVSELLRDGERFDQRDCLDPLRPDYDGGRAVGKFYWNDGMPMIHSFASGSRALRPVWTIATYPKPDNIADAVRALARVTYNLLPSSTRSSSPKPSDSAPRPHCSKTASRARTTARGSTSPRNSMPSAPLPRTSVIAPRKGQTATKSMGEFGPDEVCRSPCTTQRGCESRTRSAARSATSPTSNSCWTPTGSTFATTC